MRAIQILHHMVKEAINPLGRGRGSRPPMGGGRMQQQQMSSPAMRGQGAGRNSALNARAAQGTSAATPPATNAPVNTKPVTGGIYQPAPGTPSSGTPSLSNDEGFSGGAYQPSGPSMQEQVPQKQMNPGAVSRQVNQSDMTTISPQGVNRSTVNNPPSANRPNAGYNMAPAKVNNPQKILQNNPGNWNRRIGG